MTKEKLKIGILVDSYIIANWQYAMIDEIQRSTFAKIVLVINFSPHYKPLTVKIRNVISNKKNIIFTIHLKIDKFILGRSTDYAKPMNSENLLKGVDLIEASSVVLAFKNGFSKNQLDNIKSYELDIVLTLTSKVLIENILAISKYGVLAFEPANKLMRGEELGYWEVINKCKTTDFVLRLFTGRSTSGKVINYSSLLTHAVSISKNRNFCYWRMVTVIPRILEGLYTCGESYLVEQECKYNDKVCLYNKKFQPNIGVKDLFVHFFQVTKRLFQKMFFIDHWDVLYKINAGENLTLLLKEFTVIAAPSDRFWADPFVISKDNKHFIFVEELIYKTNKGHIAVIEIDNKGGFVGSKKVLETDYHLSYPFILEYDDAYFMVPETGENKTIELYKCIEFPYKWEFIMNLMENIRVADATFFYWNSKWWLFCCIDKTGLPEGLLDELHLFYSDSLFSGNWQSHRDNPIQTDTKIARPAGRIFVKNGKIYRPSQNCSGIYGRAININEITKLTETEYEEAVVTRIPAYKDKYIGAHTFNMNDKITVVDEFRYKRRIL